MVSHVQNKNVHNKNTDDLIGGPSFQQFVMQIAEPLLREALIAGYGDDEEQPVEAPFDSDNGSDGVVEPITQSQPLRTQSQFQSQTSKYVGHYSTLNLEAMHRPLFQCSAL